MAVGAGLDEHMRRQRREAAGHRPDVQVVRLDHVRGGDDRAADLVGVDVGRRALEEDARRVAQESPARPADQRGDEEARDRVEPVPAGRENQASRHRSPDERGQVVEDVDEGAAHVDALPARSREQQRCDPVHEDPDERDDQHDPALDVVRRDQTANRAVHDPDPDDQERQPVDLGGENLDALVAERPAALRRARSHRGGENREAERRGVGEHVPGVGEQREGVGHDAEHDLAGHEAARSERARPSGRAGRRLPGRRARANAGASLT